MSPTTDRLGRNERLGSRRPRILIVDDEDAVRSYAERVLRHGGYEPIVASDGPTALSLVEHEAPFDLFVVDLIMPEMTGDELARRLRLANPDTKVLYFTGYVDQLFHRKPTLWHHEAFVEKPVTMQGLLEAVSLLLYAHTNGPDAA